MSGNPLRPRGELKSRFESGDRPSGDDFAALIDSFLNQQEDQVYAVDGKIGVGTNIPDATLEVNGGTGPLRQSILATDGFNSTFRIAHPEEGKVAFGPNEQQELRIGQFKEDGTFFKTNAIINSEGKIAIGNRAPDAKLHVQGDLKVEEKISLGECELIFHQGRLILFYGGVQYNVKLEKAKQKAGQPAIRQEKSSSNIGVYFMVLISLLLSLSALYAVLYFHYYGL